MAQTKEEKAAYKHTYYEAHREKHLEICRIYKRAHKKEKAVSAHAYYIEHKEEYRIWRQTWKDAHPDQWRVYGNSWNRAWYEAHLEEAHAYKRAWAKAHPLKILESARRHRALKRGAAVGYIDIAAIKIRDKMLCCICGKKVAERDLSFDHTIPLVFGGPHSQENLRVAHRRCNSRRGAGRLPVQMILV